MDILLNPRIIEYLGRYCPPARFKGNPRQRNKTPPNLRFFGNGPLEGL